MAVTTTPLPPWPGPWACPWASERDLQASHKDFATAHQQVEWFLGDDRRPAARLGEVRSLGPLPPRRPDQRAIWQADDDTLSLVRPADADGLDSQGQARVWLRISQGLEPLESRKRQLDLAMAVAIALALALSAASATWLARRVVKPLEHSLRRLRDFELDASHELRGPLAARAAHAEMGQLDCAAADENQKRRFEAIASATDQLQRLVDDLLTLARQEQGASEAAERIDLSDLVRQQLALYGDVLALSEQRLQSDLEAGLRRGRLASLEVSDEGPGMAPEQLPRVFDRLWRASPDRGDGGSGMGLAIAARICRAHGGDIRVASAPGQGCQFVVELPLASLGLRERFAGNG